MTRDDFARIALRYDTALSRAMLRALGVPVPHREPHDGEIVACDRFDGIADCFNQRWGVEL